jgi:nicotinamidase-related amidase
MMRDFCREVFLSLFHLLNGYRMTTAPDSKTGLGALLTPQNSTLLLIDHQAYQFSNLHSHEPTLIINNVVALAKTAKVFGIPTIFTTVLEERGGYLLKPLQAVFPDQKPINRTFINTWEDQRIVDAVEKAGRKKLLIAGLFTEICVAYPTIQALGEGYEVYVVTDASGGVSTEAHERAVQRMVQAGAVPVTWFAVMAELQRDWARLDTLPGVSEIVFEHGGGGGVTLQWKAQLLNTHEG